MTSWCGIRIGRCDDAMARHSCRENNRVKIWNDGKGVPVVLHEKEKMYVPTLIFGHLLTSSNYDDTVKKVTGERGAFELAMGRAPPVSAASTADCDAGRRSRWANGLIDLWSALACG